MHRGKRRPRQILPFGEVILVQLCAGAAGLLASPIANDAASVVYRILEATINDPVHLL